MRKRAREPEWPGGRVASLELAEAQQSWSADAPAVLDPERIRSVLDAAREERMLEGKTARISGRISPMLIARAKARTGIASDSELIEFALASLALDDDFMTVFARLEGTIDPDLPLGY